MSLLNPPPAPGAPPRTSMASHSKVLGHASHQVLIVLPLGAFTLATVFDGVYYFFGRDPQFAVVSYWLLVGGLLGGMLAAVPGWIDWFAIPSGTRAKAIGLWHGLGNGVGVLGLFGASWYFRRDNFQTGVPDVALLLSLAAFGLSGLTAWLGGELVDRLGIGVDPGAHPDAPNSLTGRPATDTVRES